MEIENYTNKLLKEIFLIYIDYFYVETLYF